MLPVLRLSEIVAALADHGGLLCAASIERSRPSAVSGGMELTVTLTLTAVESAFEVVSLQDDLQHAIDMGSLRALADKYDIDAQALEALLRRKEG